MPSKSPAPSRPSLAHGRPYLAIPGPSVMPDAVLRAMHRAAPNIYEGELVETTHSVLADLSRVAGTAGRPAIYIANGHGAWEAALANVAGPGDRVLVPATGQFGHGWAEVARRQGIEPVVLDFGRRGTFDAARVSEALAADGDHRIKAVLGTHVDTATSVRNDMEMLRRCLDETGHPALLMADCIASFGCDRFRMDAWGVDVTIAASQKGLMTPPGLALVFVNARAVERTRDAVSSYWDWRPRVAPDHYYQLFCGTAPTHHIYGLRAALDMILDEGIAAVWDRHARLARAVWAACDAWGADGPLELNLSDPAIRSHAVTALRIGADRGDRLRQWCDREGGVTLGIGLGMAERGSPEMGGFFRIGHMGHVNAHMVMGALAVIEAGLQACEIPHGTGALAAAASVCAEPWT